MTAGDDPFAAVVEALGGDADVGTGRGFGSDALKVGGKIFAMEVNGRLVVKLPRARVEELVGAGTGAPFDPGHGRIMKEWVTISPERFDRWLELAEEARAFVAAGAGR